MPSRARHAALCACVLLGCALAGRAPAAGPAAAGRATPAKPQAAAPRAGDAAAGKDKAEAGRCFECHGVDGQGVDHGNATAVFARLAGQHSGYIVKQLRDFSSGARKHDVMRVMAQNLDDEDQRDIAAYFAALPAMQAASAAAADIQPPAPPATPRPARRPARRPAPPATASKGAARPAVRCPGRGWPGRTRATSSSNCSIGAAAGAATARTAP